jgi:hypothetical protein
MGPSYAAFPNPQDVGLAQINLPTWSGTAKKLGFDVFTYDGNLAMAKWIFDNDRRHEENWKWSGSVGNDDLRNHVNYQGPRPVTAR